MSRVRTKYPYAIDVVDVSNEIDEKSKSFRFEILDGVAATNRVSGSGIHRDRCVSWTTADIRTFRATLPDGAEE